MKGIAILANIFMPDVGSFIIGKVGQGIGQIFVWGFGLLLTLGTLGIGGVIGIPLMLGAWIWAIVTAAGGPAQPVQVNIIDNRDKP
jgi:TM2 domain-containing membrane protein YozV